MNGIARLLIVAGLVLSGLGTAQAQSHHYRDNGDGTVSDLDTGLMWEKKTGTVDQDNDFFCPGNAECRDVHNVGNRYRWSLNRFGEGEAPDGPCVYGLSSRSEPRRFQGWDNNYRLFRQPLRLAIAEHR